MDVIELLDIIGKKVKKGGANMPEYIDTEDIDGGQICIDGKWVCRQSVWEYV